MLTDYIENREYLVDDSGASGGLNLGASFVGLGDLNSDPHDGGSQPSAIQRLLSHDRVAQANAPQSLGAAQATERQGKANLKHTGPAAEDTADFNDGGVGNLRVDYVLPSSNFRVVDSGVFWPGLDIVAPALRQRVFELLRCSDHRLVWIDITPNN